MDTQTEHEWEKTNLVTISDRSGIYDKMRCVRCRVTGKRFGLGQFGVKLDRKFLSAKYEHCLPSVKP